MADKTLPQLLETCSISCDTLLPVDTGVQSFKTKACTFAQCITRFQRTYEDVFAPSCWTPPPGVKRVRITHLPVQFIAVAGGTQTIGITSGGDTYTWGDNTNGMLGDGTVTCRCQPGIMCCSSFFRFSQVAAGDGYSAGLAANGGIYGWGSNLDGRLGDGTETSRCVPVRTNGSGSYVKVGTTRNTTVALDIVGDIYTWGKGEYGTLGTASCNRCIPGCVNLGGVRIKDFWTGVHNVFALGENGCIYAWGMSCCFQKIPGQTQVEVCTPVTVPLLTSLPGGVKKIAVGFDTAYALSCNNILYSWGLNSCGQMGDGTRTAQVIPKCVSCCFTDIFAGNSYALAVSCCSLAYTWGDGSSGVLGHCLTTARCVPGLVCGSLKAQGFGLSESTSFMIDDSGRLYGFGYNGFGGIGDGSRTDRCAPQSVCCFFRFTPTSPAGPVYMDVLEGYSYKVEIVALNGPGTASALVVGGRAVSCCHSYGARIEYMW